ENTKTVAVKGRGAGSPAVGPPESSFLQFCRSRFQNLGTAAAQFSHEAAGGSCGAVHVRRGGTVVTSPKLTSLNRFVGAFFFFWGCNRLHRPRALWNVSK